MKKTEMTTNQKALKSLKRAPRKWEKAIYKFMWQNRYNNCEISLDYDPARNEFVESVAIFPEADNVRVYIKQQGYGTPAKGHVRNYMDFCRYELTDAIIDEVTERLNREIMLEIAERLGL